RPGELRTAGGSPRYQIYPTRDGKLLACGALEQKFWEAFCATIGLPEKFIDDGPDPAGTKAAVAAIVAGETADHWRPKLAAADGWGRIGASSGEGMAAPHFVERGLFAYSVAGTSGATMQALPVPLCPEFRDAPDKIKGPPQLPK